MKTLRLALVLLVAAALSGCSGEDQANPLKTVDQVDLQRYAGLWYEAARMPNRFQKKCKSSTAEYTLREDGKVTVKNTCYEAGFEGVVSDIEGTAGVKDASEPGKLWVQFFWPFKGAYWVIYLDDDYQWAVVGEAGRKYLWILTRKPDFDEAQLKKLVERLPQWGYEPSRLIYAK